VLAVDEDAATDDLDVGQLATAAGRRGSRTQHERADAWRS